MKKKIGLLETKKKKKKKKKLSGKRRIKTEKRELVRGTISEKIILMCIFSCVAFAAVTPASKRVYCGLIAAGITFIVGMGILFFSLKKRKEKKG